MPHAYADQDDRGSVPFRSVRRAVGGSSCVQRYRFLVVPGLRMPWRRQPDRRRMLADRSVCSEAWPPAVDRSTDRLQGKPVALPGF